MCWYSMIGSGVSWVAGQVAQACGASEEEKKSIEGFMNVTLGAAGAIVDPVGGGLLILRGTRQLTKKELSTPQDVALQAGATILHDPAKDAAAKAIETIANVIIGC